MTLREVYGHGYVAIDVQLLVSGLASLNIQSSL
jgi:hypothetical protein